MLADFTGAAWYAIINLYSDEEVVVMEKRHIITLNPEVAAVRATGTGCGECPTSCQSACKTSCTVGNQICLKEEKKSS